MPTTPGMRNGDLNLASEEVKKAISILPVTIKHSILENPNKENVLEALHEAIWFISLAMEFPIQCNRHRVIYDFKIGRLLR